MSAQPLPPAEEAAPPTTTPPCPRCGGAGMVVVTFACSAPNCGCSGEHARSQRCGCRSEVRPPALLVAAAPAMIGLPPGGAE